MPSSALPMKIDTPASTPTLTDRTRPLRVGASPRIAAGRTPTVNPNPLTGSLRTTTAPGSA